MVSQNKLKLASTLDFDSIVDGPGLRIVVWTQGCPHHCEGCHNPQTWDSSKGELYDIDELIHQIENSNLQTGITFSGGEPFMQAEQLMPLAAVAHKKGLNVWAYSGYRFEELLMNEKHKQLLSMIDVLVDGRFEFAKKDFRLWYKGSYNQRIIDVQSSLQKETIILSEYDKQNEKLSLK